MNAYFSYKMHTMSFLCTCLVAFSHMFGLFYPYADQTLMGFMLLQKISALAYIAMTYFFFMSAYWLFRTYESSKFLHTLSKRVKSLLIPYVIFCLIGYLCAYLTFQPDTILHPRLLLDAIWNNSYNGALWYMLKLFAFVLLTPLLFLLIRWKYGCPCIILVLLFINYKTPPAYESILFWLPVYLFGGWCYYHYHKLIENKIGEQNAHPCLSFLLFILGIIFLSVLGEWAKEDASMFYIVRMVSMPLFLWMIRWLPQHHDLPLRIRQSTFLFYCLHIPLRYFSEIILYITSIQNSFTIIFLMVVIYLFNYGMVLFITNILHEANPRLLSFITGGRA